MKQLLPPRRLIPRWRRVSSTLEQPEAMGANSDGQVVQTATDMEAFERSVMEWEASPTAGHLGDVLAFSIASDCADAVSEIARKALRMPGVPTPPQVRLMKSLTDSGVDDSGDSISTLGICNPHVQQQVREVRQLLRLNPANPLVLLDFAQLQLASGKPKRAERALLSSLNLSPNNRTILRTLARFYVHMGRADQAHSLIAKHERTKVDTWLMASEIALSQTAEVNSRFLSKGWKIARDRTGRLQDIAELAGAVGGVELINGKDKQARELYRIALLQPNDNVIAQAINDQRRLGIDIRQPIEMHGAFESPEAQVLLAWRGLDTIEAERNAFRWHAEEPFSSRPIQFLASLFGIAGRYEDGEKIARRGLVADPASGSLYTSLAYCLACVGKLEDAEVTAWKAMRLEPEKFEPHTSATLGLIAMKRGEFELADSLYLRAVELFTGRQHPRQAMAICYAYYARSAFDSGHPKAQEILSKALDLFKDARSEDAALVLRKLTEDIGADPDEEGLRRLYQWIYDEENNTVVRRDALSAKGAPALTIKPKRDQ